jgi:5-methylcytosine-specific restriction endonuclease McrA
MNTNNKKRRELRRTLYRANNRCGICGKVMTFSDATFDHIIPSSQGGGDTLLNLQLAHSQCNNDKGDQVGFTKMDYGLNE